MQILAIMRRAVEEVPHEKAGTDHDSQFPLSERLGDVLLRLATTYFLSALTTLNAPGDLSYFALHSLVAKKTHV